MNYKVSTSDLYEVLVVNDDDDDVVINLPRIDSTDIGKFIVIYKMGTNTVTIK